ncbi:MAG: hypothetical protein HOH58_02860 [Opitutaceae bacterium]|nr:hypothetical protein [Opitutaceae bacterium]
MQFSIRSIRLKPGAQQRISIDVGDELARKGRWIALVSQETGQGKRVRLYLKFRPLAWSLVALMVVGYLGSAVALSLWLDRRPHNMVGFQDVVLPWRWSQLNDLRGEGFALAGIAEIEAGNASRGLFYLRRGLGLKPDNIEARLSLANLYAGANHYGGVRMTLTPQLELGYSRTVAELLFSQASLADDFPLVAEVAGKLREFVESDSSEDVWLVEQQAGALMANREPEAALEVLRTIDNPDLIPPKRRVQVLVGAGEYEEALRVAESVAPALAGLPPESLMLKAVIYANQRDEQTTVELLEEIRASDSRNRRRWIFCIEALVIGRMNEEAHRWIGDFLGRFAAQPGAIESLIRTVAITENVEVMRYTMNRITEWRALNPNLRMPLAAVLIQAGKWGELATDFSDLLGTDNPSSGGLTGWVRAVSEAINRDGAAEQLDAFLNQGPLRLLFFRTTADGFAETERWDLVKQVVDAGLRHHPHSAGLQRWNVQAQEHLAYRIEDTQINDAMAANEFNYTVDDVPTLRLKFRRMVEAQAWDQLESESLRIRLQQPAWLSEIEEALDRSEAHAAAARSDFERLRNVAPRVLRRDGEMAAWFTDQAELAVEAGSIDSAIRLLEVILAEERFYHRARAILKELTLVPEPEETIPSVEPGV